MEGSRSNREEAENGETRAEGSIHGFESLHRLLEAHLEPRLFQVRLLGFTFSASFEIRLGSMCESIDIRSCLDLKIQTDRLSEYSWIESTSS